MQNTSTIDMRRQGHAQVKPEPLIEKLRKRNRFNSKLLIIGAILFLIGFICMAIASFSDKKLLMFLPVYLVILLLNGCSIVYSRFFVGKVRRYWEQIEQRRQAAAQGDQRLLANEQPTADAHALTLPITIEQRPRLSTFAIAIAYLALSCLIGAIIGVLVATHMIPLSGHATSLMIFIGAGAGALFALILSGVFTFAMYSRVRQQITLTESGLIQAGITSKVRSIPWSEARLFALLGIYGAKKYPYPVAFELASEHEIIRWNWIRKNSLKVWYFANSRVSPEEYEQQMRGVLSVVAAKTGLPLYDLRKDIPSNLNR